MTYDRWKYWRGKMYEKLRRHEEVTKELLKELLENANHIKLETVKIEKIIKDINRDYIELEKAIVASRSKERTT